MSGPMLKQFGHRLGTWFKGAWGLPEALGHFFYRKMKVGLRRDDLRPVGSGTTAEQGCASRISAGLQGRGSASSRWGC